MTAPTPVTLLTGFLGAGKTTLLARLLAWPALRDTAVLINEFGEVGLDHLLVAPLVGEVALLRGGCVCCSIRGDLKAALVDLHDRRRRGLVPPFRRVVLETTGLADPGPAVATLVADPMLRHAFAPGAVVTVVDAVNGARTLDTSAEAVRQVAAADRLVLSKTDLAPADAAAALVARLAGLNPLASCLPLTLADVPEAALLTDDPRTRAAEAARWLCAAVPDAPHGAVRAVLIESGPVDWTRFGLWLGMLLNRHGDRILRLKGLVAVAGVATPVVVQGVQHLIHPPRHLDAWPDGAARTRLMLIARDVDPALLRRSYAAFTGLPGAGTGAPAAGAGAGLPAPAGAPPGAASADR
ncbi:P-loop guanosine triphosphatase YjiA [Methylobacterium crusticola]|uniref:P-loop guanosine triphosphatase YjiA n=1 Tax=Methylobacterium crusticola TaxID=1697972 RepID=A0ABQ4R377_9HYPH|nr:GTP-binding protein [Methylobacterium crusticola]GJD51731.1 P-loop guanosine triphosphatase YjiA [Methylobacterium crusticola]